MGNILRDVGLAGWVDEENADPGWVELGVLPKSQVTLEDFSTGSKQVPGLTKAQRSF